jgi:hypothetical protein
MFAVDAQTQINELMERVRIAIQQNRFEKELWHKLIQNAQNIALDYGHAAGYTACWMLVQIAATNPKSDAIQKALARELYEQKAQVDEHAAELWWSAARMRNDFDLLTHFHVWFERQPDGNLRQRFIYKP